MQTDTLFYIAWIAFTTEVIWAIKVARDAKKHTLQNIMAIPAVLAFLTFHTCWWMSQYQTGLNIFAYCIGALASVAFLFGASFASTGCIKLTEQGELCINEDNKIFQLVKKMPIEFDGKSLCSISWLAAISIFVIPVVTAFLFTPAAIVVFTTITLICLWTWQNPWPHYKEITKMEQWPKIKVRKNQNGLWISPTPYIVAIITVIMAIKQAGGILNPYLIKIVMTIAATIMIVYIFTAFASKFILNKWNAMTPEEQENADYEVQYSMQVLQDKPKLRVITFWEAFWQIFKQDFCPRIKYCNEKEIRRPH